MIPVLPTLVIGLREGLEAALIVGIIAAFLKTNGHSLRAMWVGVTAAVILSVAVGIGLELLSASLPQAQQEGLETIIGAIAVVFVTSMIVWMNTHARGMKRELETSAQHALGEGTAWALAAMAFLAVLKEGFETSVFLLATFQASSSVLAAVAGALIGIAAAVVIGIGIYKGGVRLNLSKFFAATGVFLVFVAAGLVVSALRTAHEAGWITIGQAPTIDLAWLAPVGSLQAALFTGVLGIPADPRVIEVLGWLLYLIPVLAIILWPRSRRPSAQAVPRLQFGVAAALALGAVILAATGLGGSRTELAAAVPTVTASGTAYGQVTAQNVGNEATMQVRPASGSSRIVHFDRAPSSTTTTTGLTIQRWAASSPEDANQPSTITLARLIELTGDRVPVGVDATQDPGPFGATWSGQSHASVSMADGSVVDASSSTDSVVTISGGGLSTPRTFTVEPSSVSWSVAPAVTASRIQALSAAADAHAEARLWNTWLPLVLVIAALALVASALRRRRALRKSAVRSTIRTSHSPHPRSRPLTKEHYAAK